MRASMIAVLTALALSACAQVTPSIAPDGAALRGTFKLGHVGIVTKDMERAAYSDEIDEDALKTSLRAAIRSKLAGYQVGYQGPKVLNIGVTVEAYALANASVPSVSSPKSVLMMSVSFWDDSSEPKRMMPPAAVIAVDGLYGTSVIRTKPLKTKDQQVAALSAKAALEIERYFVSKAENFAAK